MRIIYARHLYTSKNIKIRISDDDTNKYQLNDIIDFERNYYVCWKRTKVENPDSVHYLTSINSYDVYPTHRKAILIGVQYEYGGKTYHYWSHTFHEIGTKIKLTNGKIVTVTCIPAYSEYENTLSCKYLPKEEVISTEKIVNLWKVDFVPYNADSGTELNLNTITLRLPLSTKIEVGEYYWLSTGTIAQVKRVLPIQCDASREDAIPLNVEPFLCQFNDDSNAKYLYFTHIPPTKGKIYSTSQNQIIKVIEDGFCKIDYDKKRIITSDESYYNFQDIRMKYRYKYLKEIGTPKTPVTLNDASKYSNSNVFNKVADAIYNSTTAFNELDKSISKLVYGINSYYTESIPFNNDNNNEKENKTMNFMKNFEFGKINTTDLKMSINGLAFRRMDNTYATYDIKENTFTDVTDMILNFNHIYIMPVSAKDVKEGDVIKHLNNYVIVKEVYADGTMSAVSPMKAEEIIVIPTKNMFGFNYYSKVLNIFDGMFNADESNPFGNPLALMMFCGEGGDFGGDLKSMIPLMLLNNQGENSNDFMKNPLFLAMLLK